MKTTNNPQTLPILISLSVLAVLMITLLFHIWSNHTTEYNLYSNGQYNTTIKVKNSQTMRVVEGAILIDGYSVYQMTAADSLVICK